MTPEQELLAEAVTSAHRERGPDGSIYAHRSWHDLDDEGRQEAFERAVVQRRLEAALDPEGLSSTARAVLARVRRA